MFRFITFAFILTHSVAAQAATFGNVRIETQKWVSTYRGETEVDGLPVTVSLDVSRNSLHVPEAMVGVDTLVPLVAREQRAYRLTFIVSHNPRIQTSYPVQARNVSIDGALRFAYVSEFDQKRDYTFVVTAREDGVLEATYNRRLATGETATGQILLAPIPSIAK